MIPIFTYISRVWDDVYLNINKEQLKLAQFNEEWSTTFLLTKDWRFMNFASKRYADKKKKRVTQDNFDDLDNLF